MGLQQQIKSAVNKAFAAAGDLKTTGTLRSHEGLIYDFSTGEYVSTPVTKTVEVLLPEASKSDSATLQVLIRGSDLDGNTFTSLTVDGKTYRIETFIKTMDFIYVLTVRGGNV